MPPPTLPTQRRQPPETARRRQPCRRGLKCCMLLPRERVRVGQRDDRVAVAGDDERRAAKLLERASRVEAAHGGELAAQAHAGAARPKEGRLELGVELLSCATHDPRRRTLRFGSAGGRLGLAPALRPGSSSRG